MAGHGGKRPGSGRKKGTVSEATKERRRLAYEAKKNGITPLEYMLSILRDETADRKERFVAAKEAAPYIHPRLSAVEHSGEMKISHEEALEQLE